MKMEGVCERGLVKISWAVSAIAQCIEKSPPFAERRFGCFVSTFCIISLYNL